MKISVLIPARNEAKSVYDCVLSCLKQTHPIDEIIVVDDASEDTTREILNKFENTITVISLPHASGNKSYAQEIGLQYVTGDIVITTDADTVLDKDFVKHIIAEFNDPSVIAAAGYVKSAKHNWLTACRQLEYIIGQEVHKYAQSYINSLFVIPGCAAAFRTEIFRQYISMDHDTLTEDLDFTYKHHRNNFTIAYSKKAVVYTQDPATIDGYISQLQRWYAGSWQNILKHRTVLQKPNNAFELSLVFCEGIIVPFLLLLALVFNFKVFLLYYLVYFFLILPFALYHTLREKRIDVLLITPIHLFVSFINYAVFVEQFFLEVVLKRNSVTWIQPERRVLA